MILDKQINLRIGSTNMKYYKSIGYSDIKRGDIILVDVNKLEEGTGVKINVKCDICGFVNYIYLQKYNLNVKRCGYYSCIKCSDKKRKIFNNIKYGADNISQSDIIKVKKIETTLKNHGVENPSQSQEIKKLKCETMMKNYGVEYAMQNRELFIRSRKKSNKIQMYRDTDISYQGSYEKDFLDKYYDRIEISEMKKIKYEFDGKIKTYHPDFYNKKFNLIIEIKSDYIYNKDVDKNLTKEKTCIDQGYNFIFIINKNYSIFEDIVFSEFQQ